MRFTKSLEDLRVPGRKGQLKGFIFILFVLCIWEAFARLVPAYAPYFPPVSTIVGRLPVLLTTAEFLGHIAASLTRVLFGYAIGVTVGLALGALAGMSRLAYDLMEPVIELLRPLPSVVLLPLVILLVGIDDGMNITMIAYATIWPVFINTLEGVRSVDPVLENTGRVFGLQKLELVGKVMVPSALPYIVSGLRIALGFAVVVVISSEMVASSRGLGFFLIDSSLSVRTADTYAALLVIALIGYGVNEAFLALERMAMAWHQGFTYKERVF
jgi:ABC-type nitrate/sulfonate/bicarbonate transport system permease component